MCNVWSINIRNGRFRQLVAVTMILLTTGTFAQGIPRDYFSRRPASYVPDDDVIVRPVDNELSFYQQYVASDNSQDVVVSRNQIKEWSDNQQFAEQYGLDSTLTGSSFFVPTPDQKFEYFKDRYMRYLRNKGEQPLKDAPKHWYEDYRTSNEVDTIDQMEERFKKNNGLGRSEEELPEILQTKKVSLWKKTNFIFQPRVDQGLVVVGIKGPVVYVRAWVGVNGKTEINIQKSVDSIGLRFMANYYADTGRYFTSLDQRIANNISARLTGQRNPNKTPGAIEQDNTLMLIYARQF